MKNTQITENERLLPAHCLDVGKGMSAILRCLGPAGICDTNGVLIDVNQALVGVFVAGGTEKMAFLEKFSLKSLLLSSKSIVDLQELLEKLRNGDDFDCECHAVRSDHVEIVLHVTLKQIQVPGGGLMLVQLDEQNKQSELDASCEHIEVLEDIANQIQSEFLANMSHELRTPMHSILSFARLGFRKVDSVPRERLKSYFEMIITSGDQMLILLNDLLELSAPTSSRTGYTFHERDLVDDVGRVVSEFRGIMEESNIQLFYDAPAFMALARYDATKIHQVLRNLLANAVKFTDSAKTIRVKIQQDYTFSNGRRRLAYKVSVVDQGIGIDKEELKCVFDKFIQGSNVKKGAGGVGLGLSICKRIIEGHEGSIWAEQNRDKGTTFSFLLPAVE